MAYLEIIPLFDSEGYQLHREYEMYAYTDEDARENWGDQEDLDERLALNGCYGFGSALRRINWSDAQVAQFNALGDQWHQAKMNALNQATQAG